MAIIRKKALKGVDADASSATPFKEKKTSILEVEKGQSPEKDHPDPDDLNHEFEN